MTLPSTLSPEVRLVRTVLAAAGIDTLDDRTAEGLLVVDAVQHGDVRVTATRDDRAVGRAVAAAARDALHAAGFDFPEALSPTSFTVDAHADLEL